MNVQETIDALQKIEDKTLDVCVENEYVYFACDDFPRNEAANIVKILDDAVGPYVLISSPVREI